MAPSRNATAVDTTSTAGRVLGSTEENWTRAAANGTGVQVIGIALKRSVEAALISQAGGEVLVQSAVLRSQIVETAKGKLAYQGPDRRSVPAVEQFPWPSIDSKNHTVEGSLILPGDDSPDQKLSLALAKVVRDELNIPFPNAVQKVSGPVDVFRIHVYTDLPSQRRTLIILKFNSGPLDRPSAANICQNFLTALNAVVDGQVPQLPEAPGKNELLPALEDLVPKGKASKSLIQKGIDTVSYAMAANKAALFPFSSGFGDAKHTTFQTEIVSYSLGKEGTSALLARSKQENTTYAAALSAAFLKVVANEKELKDKKADKFSFTSLVDCRPLFDPPVPKLGLGNYTAAISQDEQVKADRKFWELARSISESTVKELGKLRHFSELPVINMLFSQVLKRPSLTPKSSLRTALFSLFVDGLLDTQWKDVDKLELAGTYGPFASMHGIGPCFCLAEALNDGPELILSLVFATPVYNRDQMEALAKSSLEVLTAAFKEL